MDCDSAPLIVAGVVAGVVSIGMQYGIAWWYDRKDRLERYARYEESMKNYTRVVKEMEDIEKKRRERNARRQETQ